jgi:hypothetical protein
VNNAIAWPMELASASSRIECIAKTNQPSAKSKANLHVEGEVFHVRFQVNGQVGDVQERAVTAQIDQLYFFG